MKERIGRYKDKIVVWGDPNLTAKNEINIDSLGEGGEQSNIPVEYYKVVVPEGISLKEFNDVIVNIMADFPCFHTVIKGTSSTSRFVKFAGISILLATTLENLSILAYAIRPLKVTGETISYDYTVTEIPSFNNIFDALESLVGEENISMFKEALIPITAEEFYNLDDLK